MNWEVFTAIIVSMTVVAMWSGLLSATICLNEDRRNVAPLVALLAGTVVAVAAMVGLST